MVSIIISVYNEESVIREKILNTLALDYPTDLLEIIISSDGSTDKTHEIVGGFDDPKINLMIFERLGKTMCLNQVVPEVKGEIVLFSDANSMYPSDLILNLVKNFDDPEIGLVTGWTKYKIQSGGEETTGLYARLEKTTKIWESRVSSCVGADGAIFAIRKALYKSLQEHDINDFVIPLDIVRQGKRVVLDSEVFCVEEAADDTEKEYKRQIRITTRTLNAIRNNMEFLNPFTYGTFSFFLWSHKILRFSMPFFMVGLLITNILIIHTHLFYTIILLGQIVLILMAFLSAVGILKGRISSFSKVFLTTIVAQLIGWGRMLKGVKDTTWNPQR